MQNATNQMVPQMQQGHYMGMNPMQSGPIHSGGMPPPAGGFSNGMPNMQGPPSTSGPQMYPPAGAFNRPQGGQMPMMPGLGPYQVHQYMFEILFTLCPHMVLLFFFFSLCMCERLYLVKS